MDLFVYKLLKKSILHISAGKKITASPSTCLGCLDWSLHSCSTTLGQGTEAGTGGALLPPHPPANTRTANTSLLGCWTQSTAQPNHRSPYAAVSVRMKILCFTATNATVPILIIGITVILQKHFWEEIISDPTIRFALCAVLKMKPQKK